MSVYVIIIVCREVQVVSTRAVNRTPRILYIHIMYITERRANISAFSISSTLLIWKKMERPIWRKRSV
jgi:hypothetical protein